MRASIYQIDRFIYRIGPASKIKLRAPGGAEAIPAAAGQLGGKFWASSGRRMMSDLWV